MQVLIFFLIKIDHICYFSFRSLFFQFFNKITLHFLRKCLYLFMPRGFYLFQFCHLIWIDYKFYFSFRPLFFEIFYLVLIPFVFFVLLRQCLFFTSIYAPLFLVLAFNFYHFIFIRFSAEILIYDGDHFKINISLFFLLFFFVFCVIFLFVLRVR